MTNPTKLTTKISFRYAYAYNGDHENRRIKFHPRGRVAGRVVPLWKMRRRVSLPGRGHFLGSRAVPPVYPAGSSIISILACVARRSTRRSVATLGPAFLFPIGPMGHLSGERIPKIEERARIPPSPIGRRIATFSARSSLSASTDPSDTANGSGVKSGADVSSSRRMKEKRLRFLRKLSFPWTKDVS